MDEFDNTVQKAKEVFSTAVKKTGDFVSIGKQKIALSSLYTKVNSAYEKLGKLLYNKIKNDETDDPEVKSAISDIDQLMTEIKVLKEEIDEAEGQVTCPKCLNKSPVNSVFCNMCGAKINTDE